MADRENHRSYLETSIHDNAHVVQGDVYRIENAHFGSAAFKEASDLRMIHQALDFHGMHFREKQIALPDIPADSFDWIWETNFVEWLTTSDDVFWITGKPGSGKSTLMHHLSNDHRFSSLLNQNGHSHQILRFFFDFRAGSSTANDLDGLLRMFLTQLADSDRRMAELLATKGTRADMSTFDTADLLDTICLISRSLPERICAFIDGLDEYEGDHATLANFLLQMQRRIGMRMILACRPYPVLEMSLKSWPTIRMQDHNSSSISMYVDYAILKGYQRLAPVEDVFDSALRTEIQERAEGVIIWARLAVDELLRTALETPSRTLVQSILEHLPQELEEMYNRCLKKTPDKHIGEFSIVLKILHIFGGQISCRVLRDIWEHFTQFMSTAFNHTLTNLGSGRSNIWFRVRMASLLGPLVDILLSSDDFTIRLMHKTVRSFIERSSVIDEMLPSSFKQEYADLHELRICRSILLEASRDLTWPFVSQKDPCPGEHYHGTDRPDPDEESFWDFYNEKCSVKFCVRHFGELSFDSRNQTAGVSALVEEVLLSPIFLLYAQNGHLDSRSQSSSTSFHMRQQIMQRCEQFGCLIAFSALGAGLFAYFEEVLAAQFHGSSEAWLYLFLEADLTGKMTQKYQQAERLSALFLSHVTELPLSVFDQFDYFPFNPGSVVLSCLEYLPVVCDSSVDKLEEITVRLHELCFADDKYMAHDDKTQWVLRLRLLIGASDNGINVCSDQVPPVLHVVVEKLCSPDLIWIAEDGGVDFLKAKENFDLFILLSKLGANPAQGFGGRTPIEIVASAAPRHSLSTWSKWLPWSRRTSGRSQNPRLAQLFFMVERYSLSGKWPSASSSGFDFVCVRDGQIGLDVPRYHTAVEAAQRIRVAAEKLNSVREENWQDTL